MEHSKLLAGVPECFYLFLQFLRVLMIFKASLSKNYQKSDLRLYQNMLLWDM